MKNSKKLKMKFKQINKKREAARRAKTVRAKHWNYALWVPVGAMIGCFMLLILFDCIPYYGEFERDTSDKEYEIDLSSGEDTTTSDPTMRVNECVVDVKKKYYAQITKADNIAKCDAEAKELGHGSYGVVVADKYHARKIGHSATLAMEPYQFPWEYCIAHVTKSPYIARVIPKSFTAIDVKSCKKTLEIKKAHQCGKGACVPSFGIEECEKMPWMNLKYSETFLHEMVIAIDDIHQNTGITLLDISPGNILMCHDVKKEKQFKFSDLAFARFFKDKTAADMMFGTEWYRSPFAIVLEEHFDETWIELAIINDFTTDQTQELFYHEYEAYDFWAISVLYMQKECGFDGKTIYDQLLSLIKEKCPEPIDNIDDIVKVIETLKGVDFYKEIFDNQPDAEQKVKCAEKQKRDVLSKLLVADPKQRLENVNEMLKGPKLRKELFSKELREKTQF